MKERDEDEKRKQETIKRERESRLENIRIFHIFVLKRCISRLMDLEENFKQ